MRARPFVLSTLLLALAAPLAAEIRRDPTGVNVNSQGATSVYITFGGLVNQVPAESLWCGELIPAAPDRGQKCDPNTIYGRLEAVDRDLYVLTFKRQPPPGLPPDRTRVYVGTLGYARGFPVVPFLETSVGSDVTLYGFTKRLNPVYSRNPVSFHVFLRIAFGFGGGMEMGSHSMH